MEKATGEHPANLVDKLHRLESFLGRSASELEIARQEFEHEKVKMLRDISILQEENFYL